MKKSDQEQFFKGLEEVKKKAEKKYKNDPDKKNKINHALQNAVAYQGYHNDTLQKNVNDFNKSDQSLFIDNVYERYNPADSTKVPLKVDLWHMSTTLASSHKQDSSYKNFVKMVLSTPISEPFPYSNLDINFFYLNSLVGDVLTYTSQADEYADRDAFILKYHPDYKNLSYEDALWKYYSTPNIDEKRDQLYNEAVKLQTGTPAQVQYGYSMLTLGAVALFGYGIIKRRKLPFDYFKSLNSNQKGIQVIIPTKETYKGELVNPIQKKIISYKKSLPKNLKKVNDTLNKTSKAKVVVAQPTTKKKITNPIAKRTSQVVKKVKNIVKPKLKKESVKSFAKSSTKKFSNTMKSIQKKVKRK